MEEGRDTNLDARWLEMARQDAQNEKAFVAFTALVLLDLLLFRWLGTSFWWIPTVLLVPLGIYGVFLVLAVFSQCP